MGACLNEAKGEEIAETVLGMPSDEREGGE
jgi:hypothetical protein